MYSLQGWHISRLASYAARDKERGSCTEGTREATLEKIRDGQLMTLNLPSFGSAEWLALARRRSRTPFASTSKTPNFWAVPFSAHVLSMSVQEWKILSRPLPSIWHVDIPDTEMPFSRNLKLIRTPIRASLKSK